MGYKFKVVLRDDFTVIGPGGLNQDQINWLLENVFWYGISEGPGLIRVTFYISDPGIPEEE